MCVGHLGEMIQDYVGDGARYGLNVRYVFDGDTLLGTAGSLKNALPALADTFFIIYGDAYLRCDYHALHQTFITSQKPAIMTVYRNAGQWDTSNVIYADNRVILYDKRNLSPQMAYIDYGIALVHQKIFDAVPLGVASDLATIYRDLSKNNLLAGYEVYEPFYEVGTSDGIQRFEAFLKTQAT
jgi:NDP-sugar pyrophosphorylase family protein